MSIVLLYFSLIVAHVNAIVKRDKINKTQPELGVLKIKMEQK